MYTKKSRLQPRQGNLAFHDLTHQTPSVHQSFSPLINVVFWGTDALRGVFTIDQSHQWHMSKSKTEALSNK